VLDLRSVETEFPAIVFNDSLTSNKIHSCEPTVSSSNDKINFRISSDEFDYEDYTIVFDKNSFSYKIISTNDLKMDLENDNEKFMPSLPSPEPTVSIRRIMGSLLKKSTANYGVICDDEAKRRNSGPKTKTFKENCYLLPYAVSSKEDTAYQRQLITRIRIRTIPDSAYHSLPIRRIHQLVVSQRFAVNMIDGN
ncbi:hypothetical protein Tco_0459128, partial [Tanacetum coccineum]